MEYAKIVVMRVIEALPGDASWEEILRAVRVAAGYRGGSPSDGSVSVREPAFSFGLAPLTPQPSEDPMERTFDVVVERDEEGFYVGSVPGIRGCHTQARTVEELMERVREAIMLCLEVMGGEPDMEYLGLKRVSVGL